MRLAMTTLLLAGVLAGPVAAMELNSRDLKPNAPMPARHIYPRCGGQNISPEISWRGAPKGTKSLALTMIDEDVKPALWSHWIVVGLPPATTSLSQGLRVLPVGARAVAGNFGDAAYDGPCPPAGSGVHHYRFTIWALPAASVAIAPDAKASDVAAMLSRTAIDHASLVVTAQR